jgi:polyphenol oxidase
MPDPHLHLAGLNLICAYSLRHHKNMSLLYGETLNSLSSRRDFLSPLGIDYRSIACAKQVHGSLARYTRELDTGKGAVSADTSIDGTDALVTDKRKLPLAVFTADCLPIFLYDCAGPAIGLIHAGWRGTGAKITTSAVQLMQNEFNTKAENLYAEFGPAIRDCCYEVEEDFNDFFPSALIKRGKHYYLDLIKINKNELLGLGVKTDRIFDSSICTSCRNEDFFSYRKEGKACGRMMSVIMLK